MQVETDSVFLNSAQNKPERIKVRIGMLIQSYVSHPEQSIAEAIAKQITEILVDPDCINDIEQRCLYRQLEMHWRCLAWINSALYSNEVSHSCPDSGEYRFQRYQLVR